MATATTSLDLLTKELVLTSRLASHHIEKVGQMQLSADTLVGLDLRLAWNQGGAFGMLADANETVRRPFFYIMSLLSVLVMGWLYRRSQRDQWALHYGLPLVIGGALGNLIDRVRHGRVVDFLDAFLRRGSEASHWPTFNVADVAITLGFLLLIFDMFFAKKGAPYRAPERAPAPSAEPSA